MKIAAILFFFFSLSLQAQFHVNGIIKDFTTKKALPFASISNKNGVSTIADVDGKFNFMANSQQETFTISYIGYEPKTITIFETNSFFTIYLLPKIVALDEVAISNTNVANAIITKVILKKQNNNPQKKLRAFQFKTYGKLLVTANPDSIVGKIDTLFINTANKKKISKIDSSDYKFKKIIDKQHLFLTEKVSLFQFKNPLLKETILGIKMAGFKEPIYEFLSFNLQSFSIYDEKYELFETKYKSPISKNALNEYRYKILDATFIDNRKVLVLYFKSKSSNGLEGLLYIDNENYAIAKAVLRIRGILDIAGIHEFTYLPEEKLWFPARNNFKLVKGKSKESTKILGGRIEFAAENDETNTKKTASDFTYISSEIHVFDLKINPNLKISKSSIAIEVQDNANNRDNEFWNQNRIDSLDSRSERTYTVLDSIITKKKIEKKIIFGRRVINGYVPFGPVDFDLRYLLSYNNFEGFRVGIGGITNETFSKKVRIEGYTAYGLKDENIKYNLGTGVRVGNYSNTWIGGSYTDDIREIASTNFATDKRVFKIYDSRPINISTFFNYKTWRGYIETKIIPKTDAIWQLSQSVINPLFNYAFNYNGNLYTRFMMTTTMLSLQWNPFSDFMQTQNGKIEYEKRYPKFAFQFTKSLSNFGGNDFDFGKIDARIEYEKKYLNGQKSAFLIQAGYAFGALPLTHLYNTSPNNLNIDKLLQRITIAGKNSFETMYFNEFFSSEYVMFQLKHGFKRVELFSKVKPTLVLVSRMAWGTMQHPERHIGIDYKTLEQGFFESGIEMNQIYKGFGLTGFYRYGANQLPRLEDNLTVKFSFIFDFGF
ncbi:MAG: carboxypeptidase-like regulatory domain-containing protein [Flavobacterium sp.]|nr:carboxypeptidase-like regulatory domain-containing protein [Flavobacterium sp.]